MRLGKFLAHAGVASRRAAEEIVRDGRIAVDGEGVTDPARDVDDSTVVELDGRRIEAEPREVHALNKPAGVVSTARDTHGRPTVVELVRSRRRLYPVGRLDADTTGLILLTNDGELADRLTHPRYGVKKVYRARVEPPRLSPRALEALKSGVELEDGRTAPAQVRHPARGVVEITIREGKKRQGRRMPEAGGARGGGGRRGGDHDPRGQEAAGPAHARGGGASRDGARARGVRPTRPARPRARQEPAAHEGRDRASAPGRGAVAASEKAALRGGPGVGGGDSYRKTERFPTTLRAGVLNAVVRRLPESSAP